MIPRIYSKAQVLSLDIVFGAVILLRFFCFHLNASVTWQVYVLLAVTVWIIYTLDHIRDAERAPKTKRERYLFHRNHRHVLFIVIVCLLVFSSLLIFFIPLVVLLAGFFLGLLSIVYLMVHERLSNVLSKELYVSIVYSLGILMAPLLIKQELRLDLICLLILLSFSNLCLFSWYEIEEDSKDGFDSLATKLGDKRTEMLIILLIAIGCSISILRFDAVNLFFISSFLIYATMITRPSWFKDKNRYRLIGDAVFLLPVMFLWH